VDAGKEKNYAKGKEGKIKDIVGQKSVISGRSFEDEKAPDEKYSTGKSKENKGGFGEKAHFKNLFIKVYYVRISYKT
jgi:hypothetical protein